MTGLIDLTGVRALVCASTSGLGEASARALAAAGARVAVTGRRIERAEAIASSLPDAVPIASDLAAPGAAEALHEAAVDALGGVDVLVLNGPGPAPGIAAGVDTDALQSALDTLFFAQVRLTQLALPALRASGWGRIVAIGSSGVETPLPGLTASNSARWALAAYLKTLAAEVASDGVTVNMVLPGRIATDRVAALDDARASAQGIDVAEVRRASMSSIPVGRYGTPEEFAAPVAFLASPAASYITGIALRCDGGLVQSL